MPGTSPPSGGWLSQTMPGTSGRSNYAGKKGWGKGSSFYQHSMMNHKGGHGGGGSWGGAGCSYGGMNNGDQQHFKGGGKGGTTSSPPGGKNFGGKNFHKSGPTKGNCWNKGPPATNSTEQESDQWLDDLVNYALGDWTPEEGGGGAPGGSSGKSGEGGGTPTRGGKFRSAGDSPGYKNIGRMRAGGEGAVTAPHIRRVNPSHCKVTAQVGLCGREFFVWEHFQTIL